MEYIQNCFILESHEKFYCYSAWTVYAFSQYKELAVSDFAWDEGWETNRICFDGDARYNVS